MLSVTSVATKGARRALVMSSALIEPTTAPTPAQAKVPTSRDGNSPKWWFSKYWMAYAPTTPDTAMGEPTDKSMPPELMTYISAAAIKTASQKSTSKLVNSLVVKKRVL